MTRFLNSQILVLALPVKRVFGFDKNHEELAKLIEIAANIHQGHGVYRDIRLVILEQDGDCESWPWGSLHSFNREVLRDEVRRALVMLRLFIRYISESPANWFYIAKGNCFGPYYEIARSCDRLIMVGRHGKVGFPEIALGIFPCGGWLESEAKRFPKQLDFWQRKSIQEPRSSRNHDRSELFLHWTSLDLSDSSLQERLLAYANRMEKRADKSATIRDPLLSFYELWLKTPLKSEKEPSPSEKLRTLWDLTRDRLRKTDPDQAFATWLIDMAAYYLTSKAFLASIAWPPPIYFKLKSCPESSYRGLLIDLREVRPPVQIIEHLLLKKIPIIFFAETAAQLRRSLELVYAQLEKLPNQEIMDLWRQYVSWCAIAQLPAFQASYPVLECHFEETIAWHLGGESYHAWIVESHPERQICLEVDDKQRECLPWQELTGAKLLMTPLPGHGIPWVQLIRSWALEELIQLGRRVSNGIIGLIQELRQGGWGFIGDEFQWERFVTRRLALPGFRQDLAIGRKTLSQEIFDYGPWKLIKTIAPEHATDRQEFLVSRRLSLHFLYLAALMWAVLCENKSPGSMDRDTADELVSRALGIPADWGRVSVFVENWGLRRCQIYISENWGELVKALSSLTSHD